MAINLFRLASMDDWVAYWRSKGAGDVTWGEAGDSAVIRKLHVKTAGTTIIIDRDGGISYRDSGPTPYDKLKAEIEKVL